MSNTFPSAGALLLVLPTVAAADPPVEPPSTGVVLPFVKEQGNRSRRPRSTRQPRAPSSRPACGCRSPYHERVAGDDPPRRTWLATYGTVAASGVVSEPPHGIVEAGGLQTLADAYAGSGVVTLRAEAAPVAPFS